MFRIVNLELREEDYVWITQLETIVLFFYLSFRPWKRNLVKDPFICGYFRKKERERFIKKITLYFINYLFYERVYIYCVDL